jgi:hypothetical protein
VDVGWSVARVVAESTYPDRQKWADYFLRATATSPSRRTKQSDNRESRVPLEFAVSPKLMTVDAAARYRKWAGGVAEDESECAGAQAGATRAVDKDALAVGLR